MGPSPADGRWYWCCDSTSSSLLPPVAQSFRGEVFESMNSLRLRKYPRAGSCAGPSTCQSYKNGCCCENCRCDVSPIDDCSPWIMTGEHPSYEKQGRQQSRCNRCA